MSKQMHLRLLCAEADGFRKLLSLQQTLDGSILLSTYKATGGKSLGGHIRWPLTGQFTTVRFEDAEILAEQRKTAHLSHHISGKRHAKYKTNEYDFHAEGDPLKKLKKISHLWTVIAARKDFLPLIPSVPRKDDSLVYAESTKSRSHVFHIFAVPSEGNIQLRFEFEKLVPLKRMTFHQHIVQTKIKDYSLIIFSYEGDAFSGGPPRTLVFENMPNQMPTIPRITNEELDVVIGDLESS